MTEYYVPVDRDFEFNITSFGADPEVFLKDADGNPYTAEGIFGGTKRKPKPMKNLPEGFFIQEDNVCAEYNIPTCYTHSDFAQALKTGLNYIRKIAKRKKLDLLFAPDADFDPRMLATPHAQELGCEPDYNAWTMEKNPRPVAPPNMRTAAAHIHLGWDSPTDEQRWWVVRACDVYLGLPSIVYTPPNRRRQLYGKAGACRLKPYGVEYRVLDNFYLESEALTYALLGGVHTGVETIRSPLVRRALEEDSEYIQEAINTHNRSLALDIMRNYMVSPLN